MEYPRDDLKTACMKHGSQFIMNSSSGIVSAKRGLTHEVLYILLLTH